MTDSAQITPFGGLHGSGNDKTQFERIAELERDLSAAREWREAVLNELIVAHIYTKEHDTNPRKAIQDAITWNCQVALDPAVSSDAQKLIAAAQEARERAEKLVRELEQSMGVMASDGNHETRRSDSDVGPAERPRNAVTPTYSELQESLSVYVALAAAQSDRAQRAEERAERAERDAERYRKARRNGGFFFSSDRMTDAEIDARIDELPDYVDDISSGELSAAIARGKE